jgi:hypothetical protein
MLARRKARQHGDPGPARISVQGEDQQAVGLGGRLVLVIAAAGGDPGPDPHGA